MDSILFRIHKKDCKEVSSSITENGFLEITVPKTDTADTALNKYLRDLSGEKRDEIVTLQKKNNEAFRKKVKKLIDKYQKEFDLPFVTTLQIRKQTQKLNDCRVQLHGIVYEGKVLLAPPLQYMPDDVIEKIVRCTVYMLALDYENKWSEINSITVGTGKYPDMDSFETKSATVSKEEKYRILYPYNEINLIKADYEKAIKQYIDEMNGAPIGCF